MGPGGIAGRPRVEQEVAETVRRGGEEAHLAPGEQTVPVGERRDDVHHRVTFATQEQVHARVGVGRGAEDQPVGAWAAEEERRVGRELDELPGLAAHPAVRPAPHRRTHERRVRQAVGPDPREQVGRERLDVVGGVEELAGVGAAEAEHDVAVVLRGDRRQVAEQACERGRNHRVHRARVGEGHVTGGDRGAVVPARFVVQLEDQSQ